MITKEKAIELATKEIEWRFDSVEVIEAFHSEHVHETRNKPGWVIIFKTYGGLMAEDKREVGVDDKNGEAIIVTIM